MGFESIDQPVQSSEVERNPKMHFIVLAGEGWRMGLESINQPSRSLEVEHNPKTNISLFWLERGGGWGSSPLTSLADHQKVNVIQKWAFHFVWLERGGRWGLSPYIYIHIYPFEIEIYQFPVQAQNQNMVVEGGGVDCKMYLMTSLADHQKLNVIQKWAFQFFGWRGVVDGIRVHQPAWPIIRSWT